MEKYHLEKIVIKEAVFLVKGLISMTNKAPHHINTTNNSFISPDIQNNTEILLYLQ